MSATSILQSGNKGTKKARKTSTWFMNTPFVFLRRKNMKKSVQKKLDSYFCPRLDLNPRTLQDIEPWKTGATSCTKYSNWVDSSKRRNDAENLMLLNKVGHLYCRICIGIEVSNLRRILCNSKVLKLWMESEFRHKFDTNPTVDDQPYCDL